MQRTNALGSLGVRGRVDRVGPRLEPRLAGPVVVGRALRLDADRAEQQHADAGALVGVQERLAAWREVDAVAAQEVLAGRQRELARHQRARGGLVDQLEAEVIALGDQIEAEVRAVGDQRRLRCRSSAVLARTS